MHLFEVQEERLEPLAHLLVGTALDDVLHHGALVEVHLEGDLHAH